MNNKSDFYVTRELFASYVNYVSPLSFEEWMNVPDEQKAAVLYCQFFDQITLAWYKVKSSYSTDQDGVDEALQYLQKNVEIIKNDQKRFTPNYIYRIMFNCLDCLCRDPLNRYAKVYQHECSNIMSSSDGDFDIFDTHNDTDHTIEADLAAKEYDKVWKVIESRGRKTVIVVAELMGEEFDWTDENADLPKANEPWRMKWKSHKCKVDKYTRNYIYSHTKLREGEEGYTEIISDTQIDENKYQIEYREYVKDNYKGAKKFTQADRDSVSEEERAEIMDFLREIFGKYEANYGIA